MEIPGQIFESELEILSSSFLDSDGLPSLLLLYLEHTSICHSLFSFRSFGGYLHFVLVAVRLRSTRNLFPILPDAKTVSS